MSNANTLSTLGEGNIATEGTETGQVCIPNISQRERRSRLMAGVIQSVISLAVLTTLIMRGANRWWRLPLFLSFWGATIGFFQWHDKTCLGLAARGSRHVNEGVEIIEDEAELAQVKRQARKVQVKSFLAAIPLTSGRTRTATIAEGEITPTNRNAEDGP